jgi:hypothetical protein
MLSVIMLCVIFVVCHYSECHIFIGILMLSRISVIMLCGVIMSVIMLCHYASCHYSECRIFIIMSVSMMLCDFMLSVIMVRVVMLCVIMLSVTFY